MIERILTSFLYGLIFGSIGGLVTSIALFLYKKNKKD